jgi:alanine racemase
MDLTTYDVTDFPDIMPGSWLNVIGPARTPDDIARDAGTNGYEVLTSLWSRYARTYVA